MMRCAMPLLAVCAFAQTLPQTTDARVVAKALDRRGVEWLMMDVASRTVIAKRWPGSSEPAPAGSLIKPFVAYAYGETHAQRYPEFVCRGAAGQCWFAPGHGRLNLEQAIAHSCNAWFLLLVRELEAPRIVETLRRFGLHANDAHVKEETFIGRGAAWRFPPEAVAAAYCELMHRRSDIGATRILAGLSLAASEGTAAAMHYPAFAKTGTAPCIHARRAPGDGYALAVYPKQDPRTLLLVRAHGVTGAEAAAIAGDAFKLLRAGGR